ncbi:MAG: alpha/beta hydrolase, partial [Gemmatimonadetes bacterium]|nr:alpha/beta hydrolase [Gemmatimonadota bacterium]
MRLASIVLVALCISTDVSNAQTRLPPRPANRPVVARAQTAIPLWAGGAPGALGNTPEDQPVITPYLPPAGIANGTAVVIFPGGGYQHLSMEKEGSDVANWLT